MAGPPIHFSDVFPTMIESLFYGAYCVLFSLCVYILCTRKRPGYKLQLGFMTVLFILPTVDITTIYAMGFNYNWASPTTADNLFVHTNTDKLSRISKSTFLISNILADLVILYRCYIIWNKSWRIMVLPSLVFICTLVSGFLEYSTDRTIGISSVYVFMSTTFLTNAVVVSLTAGRMWWLNRRTGALLPKSIQTRCHRCIVILLETGIMYPAAIMAAAICVVQQANLVVTYTSIAVLKQIVGIAPTVVIVRSGLAMSTAELPEPPRPKRFVTDDIEAQKKVEAEDLA